MTTLQRILAITVLSIFALAAPAFAENTTVSCSTIHHAAVQHPGTAMNSNSYWNGGGSNAMTNSGSNLAGTSTQMAISAGQIKSWNGGGGANALRSQVRGGGLAVQYPSLLGTTNTTPFTPWNGGGSNAMGPNVESLPAC